MSQDAHILHALLQGERLTPLDALLRFGCFRLGARIFDLRQRGYDIQSRLKRVPGDKRVAEYWMEEEAK